MTYTEEQMRDMAGDPVKLRGYFWRVAANARLEATKERNRIAKGFEPSSPLSPDVLDRFANEILEHMEVLVASDMA